MLCFPPRYQVIVATMLQARKMVGNENLYARHVLFENTLDPKCTSKGDDRS